MDAQKFVIENGVLKAYFGDAETVVVPDGVTRIARGAFFASVNMERVVLSDSVTQIDAYAFWFCTDLSTIRISRGVQRIGTPMTDFCGGIQRILVDPQNTTFSGNGLELFSADRKTLIRAPEGLDAIAYSVPDGVERIEDYAFYRCHLLQCCDVPDSVREIGESAFACCTSMTKIFLPAQLTRIAPDAFRGCDCSQLVRAGKG